MSDMGGFDDDDVVDQKLSKKSASVVDPLDEAEGLLDLIENDTPEVPRPKKEEIEEEEIPQKEP